MQSITILVPVKQFQIAGDLTFSFWSYMPSSDKLKGRVMLQQFL